MNRRNFLRNAGLTSASLAAPGLLSGCMRGTVRNTTSMATAPALRADLPDDICDLPPVHVSRDRIIRTVVGLRPYRSSGFRVEREQLGDTTVVHNYGHGGAGITLSWGTSKLALDLGAPGYSGPVAVLGAGVIGLTTSRLLQDAGFRVTIYTKALPPDTTSNIAGGQWGPVTVYDDSSTLTQDFTKQFFFACRFAYQRYQILTPSRFGVRWMRNYYLTREPYTRRQRHALNPGEPLNADDATYGLMPEAKSIPQGHHPFGDLYCSQFDGMLIEPPIFLDALLSDFRIAGGSIVQRELHTPTEVQALEEKLVFNCTGLGARALFNDTTLTPVRGQLTFLLPQPEVRYATLFEDTYMFSRRDGVLLGGTHELGDWSLEVNEATVEKKLAEQTELFSHMQRCRA